MWLVPCQVAYSMVVSERASVYCVMVILLKPDQLLGHHRGLYSLLVFN